MQKFIYFLLLGCCVFTASVLATVPMSHTVSRTKPAQSKTTEPLAEQLIKAEQNINTPRSVIPAPPVTKPVTKKKVASQPKPKPKPKPKPTIDNAKILTLRLAKLTQNIDNPRASNIYLLDHHLGISGLLNIDSKYQNSYNFTRHTSNHGMISAAKLNFDLDVNSWLHPHVGLFASTERNRYYPVNFTGKRVEADEIYLTIANLSKSAFYARLGKQYLPFGHYHRYPMFKTLPQQLSETRGNAAQIGYLDFHGIYYAVYAFHGATRLSKAIGRDAGFNNGGITLGYADIDDPVGMNVGVGYLLNMADVGNIRRDLMADYYQNRVGGISLHGDIFTGPFNFAVRYVMAMEHFSLRDFTYQTGNRLIGARPRAGSLTAGYRFKAKGRDSKFELGYQWSGEAYNMSSNASMYTRLPRRRVFMAYGVQFFPNLIFGVEVTRDRDYALKHGGTNRFNNTISARVSLFC